MRSFKVADWSFIPGPELDPPGDSLHLQDVTEYPPQDIAAAILSIPGMRIQNPGEPTWWEWSARWQDGDEVIDVGMSLLNGEEVLDVGASLLETEPVSWGGSSLQGACSAQRLLSLW